MSFWNKKNIISGNMFFYDLLVNKLNCKYIWRCNYNIINSLYDRNISKHHLEIGPGTGFFINKFKFDNLTLCDINQDILDYSFDNLKNNSKNISKINFNLFDNLSQTNLNKNVKFESVGANYVLHCIPGKIEDKLLTLVHNLKKINKSHKCVLYGGTVINDPYYNTFLSNALIKCLNHFKIFNNKEDFSYNIINNLEKHNIKFDYSIVGCVFIFKIEVN